MQSEPSYIPAPPPAATITSTTRLESVGSTSGRASEDGKTVNSFVPHHVKLSNVTTNTTIPASSSQTNVSSSQTAPTQSRLIRNQSQIASAHTHDTPPIQSNSRSPTIQSQSSSRDSDQELVEEEHPRSSATRAIVSILRIQAYRLVSSFLLLYMQIENFHFLHFSLFQRTFASPGIIIQKSTYLKKNFSYTF